MQYTIRGIPRTLDAALRRRAKRDRKTLNQVAVEAMAEGLGVKVESQRRRSFREFIGTRSKDFDLEAALDAQRQIDPDLWR